MRVLVTGATGFIGTAVVRRCYGDRLDAFGPAGPEDAQRDLTSVRDEQPAHGGESRVRLAERLVRVGEVGSTLPRLTRREGGTAVCG